MRVHVMKRVSKCCAVVVELVMGTVYILQYDVMSFYRKFSKKG